MDWTLTPNKLTYCTFHSTIDLHCCLASSRRSWDSTVGVKSFKIHTCVSRSTPGCVTAAPAAGPVGEDGAEGPEPSPAGAFLLQHIAGGSVVPAQRQSRAWARPTKAAARPEGGAAAGSLIHYTSSRIQETFDLLSLQVAEVRVTPAPLHMVSAGCLAKGHFHSTEGLAGGVGMTPSIEWLTFCCNDWYIYTPTRACAA